MSTVVQYYPGYSQTQVQQNLRVQTITAITQASFAVITTAAINDYVPGMNVTFLIPKMFGMQELNGLNVQVLAASGNLLAINLDTKKFSPFAYPVSLPSAFTPPSVIPSTSGPYLPPLPLPYGNQDSFEGTIFNAGLP